MIKTLVFVSVLMTYYTLCLAQNNNSTLQYNIIIECQINSTASTEEQEILQFWPVELIGNDGNKSKHVKATTKNNFRIWKIKTDSSHFISGPMFKGIYFFGNIVEPGDSIRIAFSSNNLVFSGKGADKFKLIWELQAIYDSLSKTPLFQGLLPNINSSYISTVEYLKWNDHYNILTRIVNQHLENYRHKISSSSYNIARTNIYENIETERIDRFIRLTTKREPGFIPAGMSTERFNNILPAELKKIFDSTIMNSSAEWVQFKAPLIIQPYYLFYLNNMILRKKRDFERYPPNASEEVKEQVRRRDHMVLYKTIGKSYKGLVRESMLAYLFWFQKWGLKTLGFVPEIRETLADYLVQPGYPEFKAYVREFANRESIAKDGARAIDFMLQDMYGNDFTLDEVSNKISIFCFWDNSSESKAMDIALQHIKELFRNEPNLLFINVSTEKIKKKWLNSLSKRKIYPNERFVFTYGQGTSHPILQQYSIKSLPFAFIINASKKLLLKYPWPDPRENNGSTLIELVKSQLLKIKDGPYVFYHDDSIAIFTINGTVHEKKHLNNQNPITLSSNTNVYDELLTFPLQQKLSIQPATYPMPEKLFVLSDIEGNFEAFKKLLLSNGIINKNFEWIFGNGHLVFAGDMFDRGTQVTECLWLIYSLEEKAKRAGGHVHFILGNHELMNLQGNHKYVVEKYKNVSALLKKQLKEVYGLDSELGRWLRTKNIIEKIGDIIFVHGGISKKILELPYAFEKLNEVARPYYSAIDIEYKDSSIALIMGKWGPLWYREFYNKGSKRLPEAQIDSILQKYNASRIVTGHTIVSEQISTHYKNKVINVDTYHSAGLSQGLLVEKSFYYGVSATGERKLLFDTKSSFPIENQIIGK